MRLLIDECVRREIADALAAAGHDVRFVSPDYRGIDDFNVARLSIQLERVLVTTDKGFGEIAWQHGIHPPGILLLRTLDAAHTVDAVEQRGSALLRHMTVVAKNNVRSRAFE